jgi:DNA helicase-2/ATP-dependent DNA helicase PcrA
VTALTVSVAIDDPGVGPTAEGEEAHLPGALNLMSIHASKGLEAPVVFVLGLEVGVLPVTPRPGEEVAGVDIEEEGRLFYVAITRAEQRLILTSSRTRQLRGDMPMAMPSSRFLGRLPETGYVIEEHDGFRRDH